MNKSENTKETITPEMNKHSCQDCKYYFYGRCVRTMAENVSVDNKPCELYYFSGSVDRLVQIETSNGHKVIVKKIFPEFYEAISKGIKSFEIRKDEDDFQKGDIIVLKEWNNGHYTGRPYIYKRITYVLRDAKEYGLKKGYCILSLENACRIPFGIIYGYDEDD